MSPWRKLKPKMGKRKKEGSKADEKDETDSPRRQKRTKEVMIRETFHSELTNFKVKDCNPPIF